MNSYRIYIKQAGVWREVTTPVFPFPWGELLDERLDEAYVTIYDRTEQYNRLAWVKVSITTGENTKNEYFIIASDTAVETPVGSGVYKHDIYIIEPIKLLEGIVCSSLTFTNPLGNMYINAQKEAVAYDNYQGGAYSKLYSKDFGGDAGGWFKSAVTYNDILTPIDAGTWTIPSSFNIAQVLCEKIKKDNIAFNYAEPYQYHIFDNDQEIETFLQFSGKKYLWKESPTVDLLDSTNTITYSVVISLKSDLTNFVAFNFSFDITAVKNHYPLKPWTITDAITRVCELAEPLYSGELPRFSLDGVTYDGAGNVVKPYTAGSLAEKYDKVFCPEVTLTQDTLREQLKVIFSYVHAEPWLDENYVIHATEYGNTEQSDAGTRPYVYNAATSHINEYCTEIRSNAQNLASSLNYAKGVMIDPANGLYRSLRSDISYARINEENGFAKTEKPIYEIQQVMCGVIGDGGAYHISPVDITPYVFEATEYNANLSSYKGGYPYSKCYAIYYTMGQPNLNGLFYQAPDNISAAKRSPFAIANILSAVSGVDSTSIYNWLAKEGAARLIFSITYKPISNHFVSHGKTLYTAGETPYAQIYNQGENLVESQFFGENIKGVAARLGNVEKERTFILKDINDVPKVGQMLDGYAITTVSCELYPFDIKCTVGLSKDFNRISEHVGINSHKRMYEISERQATQRDILIKETLVIDDKKEEPDGVIFDDLTPFAQLFNGSIDGSYNISLASYLSYNKSGAEPMSDVALPVICRSLGNTLTFNFAFKDNYSAGNSTVYIDGKDDGQDDITGRWETDVRYTDFYGRIYWGKIMLQGGNVASDVSTEAIQELAYTLPADVDNYIYKRKVEVPRHRVRKDNRETLSYNLELEIKTAAPDIIVGSALASLNGWVNDSAEQPILYLFKNSNISKLDRVIDLASIVANEDKATIDASYRSTFEDGILTIRGMNGYKWALCNPVKTVTEKVEDEDGNVVEVEYRTGGEILLASNTPLDGPRTLYFYVKKK